MVPNARFLVAVSLALAFVLQGCTMEDQYSAELSNPRLCDNRSSESQRLNCFRFVILQHNRPEYCEYYTGNKADCYIKAAVGMKDPSVCNRISDQVERYKCSGIVAGDTAVDMLSGFLGEKNETCVRACSDAERQCNTNCAFAYSSAIDNCVEDLDTQMVGIGPCQEEAEDNKDECIGRCRVANTVCADDC